MPSRSLYHRRPQWDACLAGRRQHALPLPREHSPAEDRLQKRIHKTEWPFLGAFHVALSRINYKHFKTTKGLTRPRPDAQK